MSDELCARVRECQRSTPFDERSVCRLSAACTRHNFLKPFDTSNVTNGSGTCFFLDGVVKDGAPLLVTAYHCVAGAERISVDVHSDDGKLATAQVVGASPELDVAVLRVPSLRGTPPLLPRGDSDKCKKDEKKLHIVGFANGHDHQQTTRGCCTGRRHGAAYQPLLQTDAAVNPGNSGGPVLDEAGGVVGIVVSGLRNAQGVSYCVPIHEALRAIDAMLRGERYVRAPSLSAKTTIASAAYVNRVLNSPRPGVLVAYVADQSPLGKAGMRNGDLLTNIDGFGIDLQGRIDPSTIEAPWWSPGKLPYECALARRVVGETIRVAFYSRAQRKLVERDVRIEADSRVYRTVFPGYDTLPTCTRGGLLVQSLTESMVTSAAHAPAILALGVGFMQQQPERQVRSLLVVTHVSPQTPFADTPGVRVGSVVVAVDADGVTHAVADVEAYTRVLDLAKNTVSIRFLDGQIATCTAKHVAPVSRSST